MYLGIKKRTLYLAQRATGVAISIRIGAFAKIPQQDELLFMFVARIQLFEQLYAEYGSLLTEIQTGPKMHGGHGVSCVNFSSAGVGLDVRGKKRGALNNNNEDGSQGS